ncbi:MAG TPA: glycosyltransferase family 4 protein [Gammaproteobacteria bacterium]
MDAAEWFAREVLPRIRAVRPAAVFEVVGYTSTGEKRRLGAIPGVKVVGQVPSIAEAVAGAAVGVCPMRLGAGVQNKLLEYMALGLPSVTTSVSLAGLEAKPGEHLLLANTADEMAAAVLRLFDDRALARSLAEAARAYVEQHHVWSAKLDPLVRRLDRLITARRREARPAARARGRSALPMPGLRRALWPR